MNRKRLAILVGAALVCLFLVFFLETPRSRGRAPSISAGESGGSLAAPDNARPSAPPAASLEGGDPIIETITVEKTEVCSGEDNLVTVKLAGGGDRDPNLRIMMPGYDGAGRQMPFRIHLAPGKQQPEMPEVVVFRPDGAVATMRIPPVTVKDCRPGPSLSVEISLVSNTQATYVFAATVRNSGPAPFVPVRWEWDFGDGSDATTKLRTVEHGYEDRPQKARFSSFLVHVRAIDAHGTELVGRQGLELRNNAFEVLRVKNIVLISPELNPRFPVPVADGRVAQPARLHHAHDQSITVERVVAIRYRNDEQGNEEARRTEMDPRQLLGTNVIPPGRGIETTAYLDTRAEPETKLISFELYGTSADGIPAQGELSVLPPSRPLTQEESEKEIVHDPKLLAEILATRTILGRDEVTYDDIARLRREGALDNLPSN